VILRGKDLRVIRLERGFGRFQASWLCFRAVVNRMLVAYKNHADLWF
jgi:hypothetical protein